MCSTDIFRGRTRWNSMTAEGVLAMQRKIWKLQSVFCSSVLKRQKCLFCFVSCQQQRPLSPGHGHFLADVQRVLPELQLNTWQGSSCLPDISPSVALRINRKGNFLHIILVARKVWQHVEYSQLKISFCVWQDPKILFVSLMQNWKHWAKLEFIYFTDSEKPKTQVYTLSVFDQMCCFIFYYFE